MESEDGQERSYSSAADSGVTHGKFFPLSGPHFPTFKMRTWASLRVTIALKLHNSHL